MQLIHVAAAVLNQTPLDWDGNKKNIIAALDEARRLQVSVVCLPEMCITGYGCEDAFLAGGVHRMARRTLQELLPATRGLIVSLGLPLEHRGAVYNAACLAVDGELAAFVAKQHLAGEGIHYEPRWFKRWPAGVRSSTEFDGRDVALGDLLINCGGIRIGFEICEDAWVANRPGVGLARRGVDIILNPSASHFAFAKHDVRKRFVLEGSRAFTSAYLYSNLLGNEAGRAIYDGGAMIADSGEMLAQGSRFYFADCQLTTATLDIEAIRLRRMRSTTYDPDPRQEEGEVITAAFQFPAVASRLPKAVLPDWEIGRSIKEEEFARAVGLALFDYLRKSFSHGYVVSLSGGADSAAVATLCALSVRLGAGELGLPALCEKLTHIPGVSECRDAGSLVQRLLTCVYQSTRNSSTTTREAARDVAIGLNADFLEFDVNGVVDAYQSIVAQATGRDLTWQKDDLALQNIQARARSPGIWLLANLRHALLLATSNRSEAAVGYTTMDGDTSGGLSPVAGIDKAFLRKWLRWMESSGPAETGPLPELAAVNRQQPTAELRPAESHQTDEDDLMPYDVLDEIERAAIRDKLMPLEVFQRLRDQPIDHSPKQLADWIRRFFQLWCRNQWKRERYAPCFHLDDENLDPKTWCRFPILSGGFQRELDDLEHYVAELEAGGKP